MELKISAEKFLKSIPVEERKKGVDLWRRRKDDFQLANLHDGYWDVRVPENPHGKKFVSTAFEFTKSKLTGRCACAHFRNFGFCAHLAAATIFMKGTKPTAALEYSDAGLSSNANNDLNYHLALLINNGTGLLGMRLKPILIKQRTSVFTFERFSALPHLKASLTDLLPEKERAIVGQLEKDIEGFYTAAYGNTNRDLLWGSSQVAEQFSKYYYEKLKQLLPFLRRFSHVYALRSPLSFKKENISKISFGGEKPIPEFYVFQRDEKLIVQLKFLIGQKSFDTRLAATKNFFFEVVDNTYYLMPDYEHVKLLKRFRLGWEEFHIKEKFKVYSDVIIPLKDKYKVAIDEDLGLDLKIVEPEPFVLVAEYLNSYLMMIPHFIYEGNIVAYGDGQTIVNDTDEQGYVIGRDFEFEKKFFEKLRPLNTAFANQLQQPFFYVLFKDAMKGSWFLKTIRKLQAEGVQVRGLNQLKRFRYNTNTPKFNVWASSGIDWFELKMDISFGDIDVPLQDVQNAILSGQKMVVLKDGTFGILPEEWAKQFGSVLLFGKVSGDRLKLGKKYFNILLDLDVEIREEKLLKELEEKKRVLKNPDDVEVVPVSSKIKAQLRKYQLTGFHWMQRLDYIGWGGCLADDMGLGKTLQTITFLQFIKEKYPGACSLVVCPTSLMYNWESEIQKFAPSLKYYIHHGQSRSLSKDYLKDYDIIITSYGTMRNDIAELKNYEFQYVVLDESQSIKNPGAQVTKACNLLHSKNRLVLSGTPVQNNTFDLYAQMHFLNPGFLGGMNFFRNHYAIPIDKYRDENAIAELKKMTEPFILRRTKEKVAPDLPDKSEMIMWCEMGDQQKDVYDRYKHYYRNRLLNKIEENGIKKSSFEILNGLMRLRQICDSPVLIKDPEVFTTASVKIDELLREVTENSGNHKLLVFSQFTEMLSLISKRFESNGIRFNYLDGKTPPEMRIKAVNSFQNDDSVKAFLISLKAGGVGLNLTAADYVYIVDPWWNPAVESQAIDRTHRIGQTRKVFAYKMICKGTIEEKILELQKKKKSLSEDLIGEESSFVSKLTKDDIAFLFE